MRLCVQTNKYSKLHKCPGLRHVECIFKEFQVAPKGIKKLISFPKETLNSNVKTCTWKSFPLQREQVLTKPTEWREFCMGLLPLGQQHRAQPRGGGNVSCKRKSLCFHSMPLNYGEERNKNETWSHKVFFSLLNFRWLSEKALWMVSVEETKTLDISFSWNKWIDGKLTSRWQPGFYFREEAYFSSLTLWEKKLSIS